MAFVPFTQSWSFRNKPFISRTFSKAITCTSAFLILANLFPTFTWADSTSNVLEKGPAIEQAADTRPDNVRLAETLTVSFQKSFDDVVQNTKRYIESHRSKRNAVVLDLDETLMDNRAYFIRQGKYEPTLWHQWVLEEEAIGIPSTIQLVQWMNQKKVPLFFISGRRESERAATVNNLRKIGVTKYNGLYLRPDQYDQHSMSNYKVTAQQDIQKKGYSILLLLGDQQSDMKSALGKGFKLPNPIYTVP